MYVINNSLRALLIALIPLAAVHVILVTMALLGLKAIEATDAPAPDQILLFYLTRVTIDGALLFAGHRILRQRAISSRIAYALMGGVAAAIGYAIAIHNGMSLSPPAGGAILTIGLLPIMGGMLSGFLYGQFAGTVPVEFCLPPSEEDEAAAPAVFDGPTRVRTSVAGIVLAALVPTVLTTILSFTIVSLLPTYFRALTSGPGPVMDPLIVAAIPAQMFIAILVGTIVPCAIFVLCLHGLARALRRQHAVDYAVLGGVMALICAYFLAPIAPLLSGSYLAIAAATCGGIMGATYRRFAGLEPLPLPEAVLARDPNALVGADHPARRQHNVIMSN